MRRRSIVVGVLNVVAFVLIVVSMSIDVLAYKSVDAGLTIFDRAFDNAAGNCKKLQSLANAARAFSIMACLFDVGSFGVAVYDFIGKPSRAFVKLVLAGINVAVAVCLLIAWPIMVSMFSNANDCTGSSQFKVAGGGIVSAVAWLVALGTIACTFVVPTEPEAASDDVAADVPASTTVVHVSALHDQPVALGVVVQPKPYPY